MTWQVVVVVLLVLLLRFYYTKVYLTKLLMLEYKLLFEQAGFRVKLEPFRLFTSKMFEDYREGERLYGNPLHYKENELVNYDVAICTFLNRPMIQLIHPDLMQAYFNSPQSDFSKFKPLADYL